MSKTKTAIFICGPTGIGKTSLAIEVAKWLSTEIISFDSRQFFKELKIGAAPPAKEELAQVKHHLVGHLNITDDYNAGAFEKEALRILENVFQENETAILVGGSGLYMKALTDGFDDMPNIDSKIREKLNLYFSENGIEALQKLLLEKDSEYYAEVDIHNPQRLIRALELIKATGEKYSSMRQREKADRPFNILKIGLNMDRNLLYDRINRRVDIMLDEGLEQEVRSLIPHQNINALQTVGYKELFQYFKGEVSFDFAIEEIKKNSRRYAKRQLTWFRRDDEIHWFQPNELEAIKSLISSQTLS